MDPILNAVFQKIADDLQREAGPMAGILEDCEQMLEQCRAAVAEMRADVFARGRSVTHAMEKRPALFPAAAVEAVRAGEQSGELAAAFRAACSDPAC
ncbi:hypothetical protein [Acanthopleuribacter pedis]|uniref:Uncharacterized protein n=1 Tax=Acanthopleuribacter pedis TaxID=442870 RepID=A0A8J7QDR1_9BACT|nr:hypothetical protein [Acanthopleuribacter pedis]MBO1321919.1 hypothetical protein [Acanthopleuribacter pedis]